MGDRGIVATLGVMFGLVAVGALAACSLKADYTGTLFACDASDACPDHYVCLDQLCAPEPPTATAPQPPATAACTQAVRAGQHHTCAIRSDGTTWCWGRNDFGQLGDGTATDQLVPVQVATAPGVQLVAIAPGLDHTCAIDASHQAWCWGHGNLGQIGNRMAIDSLKPTQVADLADAATIVSGDSHSCALRMTGGMVCWGGNASGQLGNASTTQSNAPIAPAFPPQTTLTAIAAGVATTCAIDDQHQTWCWGSNTSGQLADGSTVLRTSPVVARYADAVAVGVGTAFSCALSSTGVVACTGSNDHGQLGIGNFVAATSPVTVALGHASHALAVGGGFACATDDQQRAWCWGENDHDELAFGSGDTQPLPVLTAYAQVKDMTAGLGHLCTRTADGALTCGGFDSRGQLGDGARTTQGALRPVTGLTGITAIAGGVSSMCAVQGDGRVVCWGANGSLQLGDGTRTTRTRPTQVPFITGASQVAAGASHTCALIAADGSVMCWGRGDEGELGDNGAATSAIPHAVVIDTSGIKLTGVTRLALAGNHACALAGGGVVRCWGQGSSGQNGGSLNDAHVATAVNLQTSAIDVAVGTSHSCAITASHGVLCWGNNSAGQLGPGAATGANTGTPIPVVLPGTFDTAHLDQISAHGDFTCVHAQDGSVLCWGVGSNGEAGIQVATPKIPPSTPVVGLGPSAMALAVATGSNHACATKAADKPMVCWGASTRGQIGDAGYDVRTAPVDVPGTKGVQLVAAAGATTCAVMPDQTVACWGDDRDGELGDGVAATRALAVPMFPCP